MSSSGPQSGAEGFLTVQAFQSFQTQFVAALQAREQRRNSLLHETVRSTVKSMMIHDESVNAAINTRVFAIVRELLEQGLRDEVQQALATHAAQVSEAMAELQVRAAEHCQRRLSGQTEQWEAQVEAVRRDLRASVQQVQERVSAWETRMQADIQDIRSQMSSAHGNRAPQAYPGVGGQRPQGYGRSDENEFSGQFEESKRESPPEPERPRGVIDYTTPSSSQVTSPQGHGASRSKRSGKVAGSVGGRQVSPATPRDTSPAAAHTPPPHVSIPDQELMHSVEAVNSRAAQQLREHAGSVEVPESPGSQPGRSPPTALQLPSPSADPPVVLPSPSSDAEVTARVESPNGRGGATSPRMSNQEISDAMSRVLHLPVKQQLHILAQELSPAVHNLNTPADKPRRKKPQPFLRFKKKKRSASRGSSPGSVYVASDSGRAASTSQHSEGPDASFYPGGAVTPKAKTMKDRVRRSVYGRATGQPDPYGAVSRRELRAKLRQQQQASDAAAPRRSKSSRRSPSPSRRGTTSGRASASNVSRSLMDDSGGRMDWESSGGGNDTNSGAKSQAKAASQASNAFWSRMRAQNYEKAASSQATAPSNSGDGDDSDMEIDYFSAPQASSGDTKVSGGLSFTAPPASFATDSDGNSKADASQSDANATNTTASDGHSTANSAGGDPPSAPAAKQGDGADSGNEEVNVLDDLDDLSMQLSSVDIDALLAGDDDGTSITTLQDPLAVGGAGAPVATAVVHPAGDTRASGSQTAVDGSVSASKQIGQSVQPLLTTEEDAVLFAALESPPQRKTRAQRGRAGAFRVTADSSNAASTPSGAAVSGRPRSTRVLQVVAPSRSNLLVSGDAAEGSSPESHAPHDTPPQPPIPHKRTRGASGFAPSGAPLSPPPGSNIFAEDFFRTRASGGPIAPLVESVGLDIAGTLQMNGNTSHKKVQGATTAGLKRSSAAKSTGVSDTGGLASPKRKPAATGPSRPSTDTAPASKPTRKKTPVLSLSSQDVPALSLSVPAVPSKPRLSSARIRQSISQARAVAGQPRASGQTAVSVTKAADATLPSAAVPPRPPRPSISGKKKKKKKGRRR